MSIDNTVTVQDVVVDHRTRGGVVRALDHASLVVPGGSSVAIMGPSGCGKSTLLGLLAGLALPTSGTITIGEQVVSQLSAHERVRFRRQALGMVYQADNLLPHLTIEENVGLAAAICRRDRTVDALDVGELLGRLGLDRLAKRFPDQLSGGQRQRAAVARAVVHRPRLILGDEPTGALDEANARGVIELLMELHRHIGATLVVVTHDPAIAAYASDRMELARTASMLEASHVG